MSPSSAAPDLSPGGAHALPPQSAPPPIHAARGPAIAIALFAIRAYQRLISPAFAGHCRFTPSCSEYAHEAIARHGWKGLWLAARRLLRCHPLGSSGYDPVR